MFVFIAAKPFIIVRSINAKSPKEPACDRFNIVPVFAEFFAPLLTFGWFSF